VKCSDALELLDDHVDENLSWAARWRLRVHLWICRHCRKYLSSYRTTVRAGQAALRESDDDSAVVPDGLVQSIVSAARVNCKKDGEESTNAPPPPKS